MERACDWVEAEMIIELRRFERLDPPGFAALFAWAVGGGSGRSASVSTCAGGGRGPSGTAKKEREPWESTRVN
jgi:hypothetical protein